MGRPVVLSNGELHVGLNKYGLVHDFYYPYVGLENHCAGQQLRHKVGVWVDDKAHWLDDGSWNVQSWTAEGALIGHTRAVNHEIGILIEFDDTVDANTSVFLRNIHVINLWDTERDARLFTHQAFAIGDSRSNTDTAQYLPDSNAVLHYRGRRAFVISGNNGNSPFDQHSIGLFGIEGREGTYRDADDGELAGSVVEHGRVDSTLRFKLKLKSFDSARIHYWIAAGTSTREALDIHKNIQEKGIDPYLHTTAIWWHDWLEPVRRASEKLDAHQRDLFIHSAMVVKSHIDNHGAVIASTDTTMLNYSRDAYAYCWPRDGAFALWPLIRLGYTQEPLRYFEFVRGVLHQSGYVMHKYRADGALGSSWHPYVHSNGNGPPIQEDETALTVFMFSQFYNVQKDPALLSEFYDFIKEMADFLVDYIDEATGLPRASYDLWEEVHMTTTYTTSVVFAGLQAAAEMAEAHGDPDSAVKWRSASEDILTSAQKYLFNDKRNHFYKGVITKQNGELKYDETIDLSSFFGAYMFGLFPLDSDQIKKSFDTIKTTFMQDGKLGIPRYENDNYNRNDQSGLGNTWFIASLWIAQYAQEVGDSQLRASIIDWIHSSTNGSLMLAEQLNPVTADTISVSPLVWSHAEYIATQLDVIDSLHQEQHG